MNLSRFCVKTSFLYVYLALLICSTARTVHGVEKGKTAATQDVDTSTDQVCLAGDQDCRPSEKLTEAEVAMKSIDDADDDTDVDNHVEGHADDDDDDDNDNDYYNVEEDDDDYADKDDGLMVEDQEDKNAIECTDSHDQCNFWASLGECEKNPKYMLENCQASCKTCKDARAPAFAKNYGETQECSGENEKELLERVQIMDKYMKEVVSAPEYDKVRSECKNRHKLCVYWAFLGECEANEKYMLINCAPSCETCKQIDYDYRCPRDPNEKDSLEPGDLESMFSRITSEVENVTVLSKPDSPNEDGSEVEKSKKSPWVITVDNFITEEECDRLIELGGKSGYERSTDVGKMNFDGTFEAKTSTTRTSRNAWCEGDCYKDELVQNVLQRIAELTGIPDINSEYLQLLQYETGQFYRRHHDYIEADENRPQGPRILTAFLYLNDVEKGGGTNFPQLDLTVMPKRGRILLWPSVRNDHPSKKDYTTEHQALDVEAGYKYAANAWIHLRKFKTHHDNGCTG